MKKLKKQFSRLAYPYLGSSMLTNELLDSVIEENSKECENIADEFAIGFLDWYGEKPLHKIEGKSTSELLKYYKKESNL